MTKAGILFLALLMALTLGAAASSASPVGGMLSGRIVDGSNGSPVNAASITVKGTPLRASSDGDGAFVLRDVPAGVAMLEVERVGYKHRELTVSVSPDDPTEWTIALSKTKQ